MPGPTPPPAASCGAHDLSVGLGTACVATTEGVLRCWNDEASLVNVAAFEKPARVVAGSGFACAIEDGGKLSCFGGLSKAGISPFENAALRSGGIDRNVVDAQAGHHGLCWLKGDASLWCFSTALPEATHIADDVTGFTVGQDLELWIEQGGSKTWRRMLPQPGGTTLEANILAANGALAFVREPKVVSVGNWAFTAVNSLTFPEDIRGVAVAPSQHFMCAHGDSLHCWGSMDLARTAPIQINSVSKPTPIRDLPGKVMKVSAGFDHVCALNDAAEIWCFGRGIPGEREQSDGTLASVGLTKLDICTPDEN